MGWPSGLRQRIANPSGSKAPQRFESSTHRQLGNDIIERNMNQKGFINILLIIIVVALVGAGAYFVSTKQITPSKKEDFPARIPHHKEVYRLDSGVHDNLGSEEVTLFSKEIKVLKAPWLQLHISKHNLGKGSYLLFTSLKDGGKQSLNATTLQQWENSTAYFNGDAVRVELHVASEDKGIFFRIDEITVGDTSPVPNPSPSPSPTPTPTSTSISDDPYSWPIQNVCTPVARPEDPVVTRDLHDGTYVYQRSDGTLFRGYQNRCRCLSGQTLISTPDELKMIKDLKIGMYVFTLDRKGNKVVAPLINVAKVSVPNNYLISHVLLSDNRELFASNAHPTADGRTIGELLSNDDFDGARVVKKELVSYGNSFTYDILPAGDTGFYWANGILLGSTLH